MKLSRDIYLQDVLVVSPQLLGKVIHIKGEHGIRRYRIVETEAYDGRIDRASHAFPYKRTKRTEVMFEEGGRLYIYLIYGMYYCLNIVVNVKDTPQAILIRALEPLDEGEITNKKDMKTNGPGKLCKHLGIDSSFNGEDLLTSQRIWIEDDGGYPERILATTRINIDYAGEDKDLLWRFIIDKNRFISQKIKKDVQWLKL